MSPTMAQILGQLSKRLSSVLMQEGGLEKHDARQWRDYLLSMSALDATLGGTFILPQGVAQQWVRDARMLRALRSQCG